jgi:hypothetical protein
VHEAAVYRRLAAIVELAECGQGLQRSHHDRHVRTLQQLHQRHQHA